MMRSVTRPLAKARDIGRKRRPGDGYANPAGLVRGQVVKVGLDGRVLARLDPPPLEVYET